MSNHKVQALIQLSQQLGNVAKNSVDDEDLSLAIDKAQALASLEAALTMPPVVAEVVAQVATQGVPYTVTFSVTGALTVDLSSDPALPATLTFDEATLTLSGTPAAGDVGAYTVTITAENAGGTATSSFTLTIS